MEEGKEQESKFTEIPTWHFDQQSGEWTEMKGCAVVPKELKKVLAGEIKIATLNVLLDQYDDNSYFPGFLYHEERYQAIAELLQKMDLDIICLNECTRTCLMVMEAQEWIQANYVLSECTKNDCKSLGYRNFGNLMISRVQPQSLNTLCVKELESREVIVGEFLTEKNGKNEKLIVAATHLTARTGNYPRRARELNRIYDAFDTKYATSKVDHFLILGDLNFHAEHEKSAIREDYEDIWMKLYNLEKNPGYTWNATENKMSQQIWPVFESRKMRLDRILYKAPTIGEEKQGFKPELMEIFANKPIYNPDQERKRTPFFPMIGKKIGDLFGKNWRRKEDYLYPSDHYGLWVKFHL